MAADLGNKSEGQRLARSSYERKRTNSRSSSPKLAHPNLSLDGFDDNLLIEVLLRLPATRSAIHCKLVSKRWCSLISTPYFITRFINHHVNAFGECQDDELPTVFLSYMSKRRKEITKFELSEDSLFESTHLFMLTRDHLPEPRRGEISILASCNDLILCSVNKLDSMVFYVCNPITMQWFALPPIKIWSELEESTAQFGLVSELCYRRDAEGGCSINDVCRFRVVCLVNDFEGIRVKVYCSENNQWSDHERVLPRDQFQIDRNVVAHDGKLHWYNGGAHIVAYDPFNNVGRFRFIDCSKINSEFSVNLCLGVCRGHLYMLKWGYDSEQSPSFLAAWKLNDREGMEWTLEHKVYFHDMISKDSWLRAYARGRYQDPKALAFHPRKKGIVYLEITDRIISCDLQKQELKVVGSCSDRSKETSWWCYYQAMKGFFVGDGGHALPIFLPWWPTPLPPLPPENSFQLHGNLMYFYVMM